MSQSIALANVNAAYFNGAVVKAINLNGAEIWKGSWATTYTLNTFNSTPKRKQTRTGAEGLHKPPTALPDGIQRGGFAAGNLSNTTAINGAYLMTWLELEYDPNHNSTYHPNSNLYMIVKVQMLHKDMGGSSNGGPNPHNPVPTQMKYDIQSGALPPIFSTITLSGGNISTPVVLGGITMLPNYSNFSGAHTSSSYLANYNTYGVNYQSFYNSNGSLGATGIELQYYGFAYEWHVPLAILNPDMLNGYNVTNGTPITLNVEVA